MKQHHPEEIKMPLCIWDIVVSTGALKNLAYVNGEVVTTPKQWKEYTREKYVVFIA